jgi:hypothetical protein
METTFGDTREMIVATIMELRAGTIKPIRALAIAANMKVLNESISVEIKAARLSIDAEKIGKDFGEVMRLGTRPIKGETPLLEG